MSNCGRQVMGALELTVKVTAAFSPDPVLPSSLLRSLLKTELFSWEQGYLGMWDISDKPGQFALGGRDLAPNALCELPGMCHPLPVLWPQHQPTLTTAGPQCRMSR